MTGGGGMALLVLNPDTNWRLHDPTAKRPPFPVGEREKRPGASGKQKKNVLPCLEPKSG